MSWIYLFGAWVLALVATLGALFMGEIMGMEPCILCWYQRIAMFPLAIILFFALFPTDSNVVQYSLPLALVGTVIAGYHNLLYWNLLPADMAPCTQGSSCTDGQLVVSGIVPIPLP